MNNFIATFSIYAEQGGNILLKHSLKNRLYFVIIFAVMLPISLLSTTLSTHDEAATIPDEPIILSVAPPAIIHEIPSIEFTEQSTDLVTEEVTEEIASTEITEVTEEDYVETSMFYSMSDSELKLFAKLLYLEAGNTSYKCQLGVASVVMNLMITEGISLKSCIYTPGRFSVASQVARSTYSDSCMKAAKEICQYGPIFPRNVKCFRNNHYFDWATPYTHIDNVYFSSY